MHVLIDLRTLDAHFPGIGRYASNVALALSALPDAPRITAVLHKGARTDADLTALAQRMRVVLADAAVFGVQQHVWFPWLARRVRADVALFPFYVRPLWVPCPSATVIHDTIYRQLPALFPWRSRLVIAALHRLAVATSQRIVVPSRSAQQDVAQAFGLDAQRIVVAPNAAAPNFKPAAPAAIAALRERYDLPEQYVLFLASDKPHKNLAFLLDCWGLVDAPGAVLAVGGLWSDPASRLLVEQPELRGRVRLLGPVPEADLPGLYSGARALAFPSAYEGFGLPAVEAAACGTPVLAPPNSALPEVVGRADALIPLNAAAWAAALQFICTDAAWRAELAAAALAHSARFSWSTSAATILRSLQELVDQR